MVTIQPFEIELHRDLLRGWLACDHVRRWWGEPEHQLQLCLDRPVQGGDVLILEHDRPVGYLRWQQVDLEDLQAMGLTGIPEGAVDMDILIGERDRVGQGIGPEALRLMIQQLRHDRQTPLIGMTTSIENQAAIRAYEKAGFHKLTEYEDPVYGPCWVMVMEF